MARVASPTSFKIKRSERAFFVGKTGSGKTTLAKALLYAQPHVFILDPKHTFTLPDSWKHSIYKTMSELESHNDESTAIYRPDLDEMDGGCNEFFELAFAQRNRLIFVDEVIRVTPNNRIKPGYKNVLQLGRELNVGCWSATQRPSSVPIPIMTEAEHYFIFRLTSMDDRKRLRDWLGYDELMTVPKDPHGFYHYSDITGKLVYYSKANLGILERK